MYIEWTKNLNTDKEKANFSESLVRSKHIMDRLKSMLEERELALENGEISRDVFDNPNWAYQQAYDNGYKAALRTVHKLVNLDQQKVDFNDR